MIASTKCNDCGDEPRPGSVVRLTGKDASGNTMSLCSRCFLKRGRDISAPALPKLKRKGKR